MQHELAFASIRQGELSAADAWKLLSPLAETEDRHVAAQIFEALRSWVWKTLDRRRRDDGLREWIDVLNRTEAFLADRFEVIAARIEVLVELLHESIAVASLASPEDLLRRKHVAPILRVLACHEGEWLDRAALMDELGLRPANTTRLMTLLVDAGWAEQVVNGREAAYRISAEGLIQARALPPKSGTASRLRLFESADWKKVFIKHQTEVNVFSQRSAGGALDGGIARENSNRLLWRKDASDLLSALEVDEYDDELLIVEDVKLSSPAVRVMELAC